MPEMTQLHPPDPDPSSAASSAFAGLRLDTAHKLGRAPAPPTGLAPPVGNALSTGDSLADAAASSISADGPAPPAGWALTELPRLRLQGRQLAQLLQERQRDLDRREAQQQAFAADIDNQLRAARLWLAERHQELAERQTQLAEREGEAAELSSRLSAAEAYLDRARREMEDDMRRREEDVTARTGALERMRARLNSQAAAQRAAQQEFADLREREHNAAVRERQEVDAHRAAALGTLRLALDNVEQRRLAVEAEAAALEQRRSEWAAEARRPSPEQLRRTRELTEIAADLAAREQNLAAAEELQIRVETELSALRHELDVERERLGEQARVDRRRIAESERAAAEELASQREAQLRQSDQFNERQASLERLRAELTEVHREALEARLAAEETLARLVGTASAGDITKALADTRARLADHWRLAAGRVAEERAALTSLRDDIGAQAQKLTVQKDDLTAWVERRQREFDQQAAGLAERDAELRHWENEMRAERDQWVRDRLAFEQQLRSTVARLREAD